MIIFEKDIRKKTVLAAAEQLLLAIRTAPKARGIDHLEIALAEGEDLVRLAEKLEEYANQEGRAFFGRDAANIRQAEAVILVGSSLKAIGLNCGYCGFATCEEKNQLTEVPCFFNANDLGIAIGSAVSKAADLRIDNRVMFSVGWAAKELKLLPNSQLILGIPLSVSPKSPFFDRQPK